jgi:Caspase domain
MTAMRKVAILIMFGVATYSLFYLSDLFTTSQHKPTVHAETVPAGANRQSIESAKGFALLVGAGTYLSPNWRRPSESVRKEIDSLEGALTTLGYVVQSIDPSASKIREALRALIAKSALTPDAAVVIYLSGYSRWERPDRTSFAAIDSSEPSSDRSSIASGTISQEQIEDWASELTAVRLTEGTISA